MRLVLAVAVTMLAGCGGLGPTDPGGQGTPQPAGARSDPEQRYEWSGVILESPEHGPMLCLGMLLDSLPPQCGDVPLTAWDWGTVDGEERLAGTIWGEYRVIGTYDGSSFRVLEVGPPDPPPAPDPADPVDTPCSEPPGGWEADDPGRTSEADRQRATRAASSEPDFAGLWIDHVGDPAPEDTEADPTSAEIILNVAFTEDIPRHESDLRALWGGPLCVVQHARTEAELRSIQRDLPGGLSDLGLTVLWTDVDIVDNVVEVGVVAIDPQTREALDDRYGPDTLRAVPALRPLA
ncbi:MAG TPA: hypothetical protein VJ868_01570 [Actinomycetota bacterium]|nr:hypothetical protein [Actinomycetota bacterium]